MKLLMLTQLLLAVNILSIYSQAQSQVMNDEFDTSELDLSWELFQPEYYVTPVPVINGFMQMSLDEIQCDRTCVWWLDMNAGMIHKSISGDFDVSTAVYAKQKSDPTFDIDNDTQLAGLIARDPNSTNSGLENYIFNVAGIRFDDPSVELKSTMNNSSTIRAYTDNLTGTASELRIKREGNLFSLYSRAIGQNSWILRDTFDRPDLPDTLQVGLIAYVFESYPGNLLAQFDYFRFNDLIFKNTFE